MEAKNYLRRAALGVSNNHSLGTTPTSFVLQVQLPRLPLSGFGRPGLRRQADGDARRTILHRKNHLHPVPARARLSRNPDRAGADH